ncbi:GPP34 family phosphoprotein [Pseudarthrobacter sulfonivorans]|uniref:GOLPH3/VPS74 family protein n=1 Tax=Pseudarthrobacter sulfonivorans TaxID=121292 RepID=UPI00285F17CB|nr:GPP34 family phosphoprotein [Pseudarthrobacter sulfonivorans]MDR6415274.1 hypothetical protein [Pseudarthrobacter sulfonivorans]
MDANYQKSGELSLPQAFLLLATNDTDGGPEVPPPVLRAGVAGAILAELDLLGAIELDGKHVVATGATPQTDFQHQFEIIRDRPGLHTPKKCVSMLESRAEVHRIYEGMASLGIVEHVGEKHLGIFRTTRYPEKDHAPEEAILQRIEAALGRAPSGARTSGARTSDAGAPGTAPSDARTTALIGLLYATELLGKVVPGADQGRARELANAQWPSHGVADELRMIRLAEAEAAT